MCVHVCDKMSCVCDKMSCVCDEINVSLCVCQRFGLLQDGTP